MDYTYRQNNYKLWTPYLYLGVVFCDFLKSTTSNNWLSNTSFGIVTYHTKNIRKLLYIFIHTYLVCCNYIRIPLESRSILLTVLNCVHWMIIQVWDVFRHGYGMRGSERSEKVQTMIGSGAAGNSPSTLEIETDVEMDHDSRHHPPPPPPSSLYHMNILKLFSMVARCRSLIHSSRFPNGGGGGVRKRLGARSPFRPGSSARSRALKALGFWMISHTICQPYFEAIRYKTGYKKKKYPSWSKFGRVGAPFASPPGSATGSHKAYTTCCQNATYTYKLFSFINFSSNFASELVWHFIILPDLMSFSWSPRFHVKIIYL